MNHHGSRPLYHTNGWSTERKYEERHYKQNYFDSDDKHYSNNYRKNDFRSNFETEHTNHYREKKENEETRNLNNTGAINNDEYELSAAWEMTKDASNFQNENEEKKFPCNFLTTFICTKNFNAKKGYSKVLNEYINDNVIRRERFLLLEKFKQPQAAIVNPFFLSTRIKDIKDKQAAILVKEESLLEVQDQLEILLGKKRQTSDVFEEFSNLLEKTKRHVLKESILARQVEKLEPFT